MIRDKKRREELVVREIEYMIESKSFVYVDSKVKKNKIIFRDTRDGYDYEITIKELRRK
jgi:hypothetical protein